MTAPSRVSAQHQALLHFVAQSPWSDARVLAKVLELTLPSITAREPIEAWIIDDTSFPKKGKHSVGVTRQYSGQLGKQEKPALLYFSNRPINPSLIDLEQHSKLRAFKK